MMRRILDLIEASAAYVVLPGLALLVAVDVVMRYVLNLPLRWGNDVKELLLLVVVVAALPVVSHDDQHIRVALFDRFFTGRFGQAWIATRHILTGLVAIAIAWAVLLMAQDMYRYGDRAELVAISFWPFAAFIVLAAAVSALAEFARALRAFGRGDG